VNEKETFTSRSGQKQVWEVLTIRVHALCHKRWNKLACLSKASSLLCSLIWRLIKMQFLLEVSKLVLPTAPVAREIIKTKWHARSIFNAVWTACLMWSESPQSVQISQRIKSDFIYKVGDFAKPMFLDQHLKHHSYSSMGRARFWGRNSFCDRKVDPESSGKITVSMKKEWSNWVQSILK